jgi:hypothetical protein
LTDGTAYERGRPRRIRKQRIGVGAADAKEAVVRFSLDLSTAEHQFLKRFAYDNDVPQSQVGRALVSWLHEDPEVGPALLEKIRRRLDLTEVEQLQAVLDACHRFRPQHLVDPHPQDALGRAIRDVCRAAEVRRAELVALAVGRAGSLRADRPDRLA